MGVRRLREPRGTTLGGVRRSPVQLLGRPSAGKGCPDLWCAERLEPRLLLDGATGPQVIGHWPDVLAGGVDHIDVTFNSPVDPATVSADDFQVVPLSPARLGGYDTSGSARGVAVVGNLAYVADDASGLQILDVSNPAAPILLGGYATIGNAYDVAVVGTRAYVADDTSGLQILDVTDPAAPVRLGGYVTAGYSARGVAVAGTLALLADGSAGLRTFDVTDPAAPVLLGAYDTPGYAYDVAVAGTRAYVADSASGLQILDVANPAAPVRLGGYDTTGTAYGVAVAGSLAFVADDTAGLQVIDASNAAAPTRLGGYDTSGAAQGVTVVGTRAYVADKAAGLQVVEVLKGVQAVTVSNGTTVRADLAAALPEGQYQVHVGPAIADPAGLAMDQDGDGVGGEIADDSYAFSFANDTTLPAAPTSLRLAEDGGASGTDGLTSSGTLTFSWSAPADLAGIAGYEYRVGGGQWTATAAATAQVGAAEGPGAFEVRAVDALGRGGQATALSFTVDVTLPTAPSGFRLNGAVLWWDAAGDANGIWKYQARLAGGEWSEMAGVQWRTGLADGAAGSFQVRAVDRAGNTGPTTEATLTVDYGPRVVAYAPTGPTNASTTVTVTFDQPVDPATVTGDNFQMVRSSPPRAGGYATTGTSYALAVAGNLAYVGDDSKGLQILDASNPAGPVRLGGYNYSYSGGIRGVAVAGNRAYVAYAGTGLWILDVSNPAAPAGLGEYANWNVYGVAVVGNLAYLAEQTAGLEVVDVSNPAVPIRLGGYDTTGNALRVTVVGNLAYVADDYSGLQILDVSNPAAPVRLGGYKTTGYAKDVTVVGNLAYVADGGSGLEILDVSNPASPVRVGG